ncbi:carboxylesterase, partial [Planoprotostelium fungivorum]
MEGFNFNKLCPPMASVELMKALSQLSETPSEGDYSALMELAQQVHEAEGTKPEEQKGFIPISLPPEVKIIRYVELLDGIEDDKRVLAGEPPQFTMPRYGYLGHFSCMDLEWYAAFCGLTKLCHNGYYDLVEREMLKLPESFDTICRWMHRTPKIVREKKSPFKPGEYLTTPQKGKEYADIIWSPVELLTFLFSPKSSTKVSVRFARSSHVGGLINRLCDLSSRIDPDYQDIRRGSLMVLARLRQYVTPLAEMKKHRNILTRLTKLDSSIESYVSDIVQALEGRVDILHEDLGSSHKGIPQVLWESKFPIRLHEKDTALFPVVSCRSENLFLRTGVARSPGGRRTTRGDNKMKSILFLSLLSLTWGLQTVVETTNGKIKGVEGEDHFAWKGVPFAAPPVGTNRWKAPQPIQSWTDTLNTIEYAPGCPQWCLLPARFCPNITSESCLFLNVFSPKNASGSPVMFYLAGGGFAMGDASSEVYDSARLAAKTGNVVVLANYRLGPLGWLVKGSIRGNFGLMDQHAALTWVQQNIVHFGGDPSKVTIFGESAGGMSIGAHLISRYSKGLFHRAIIQSNPLATSFKTPLVAATWGNTFSALVGCTFGGEKCLRSKTAEEITSASKFVPPFPSHLNLNGSTISLPWDPTVDGDWVPEQ